MSEGIFKSLERIVNSAVTGIKKQLNDRKVCAAKIKAEDLEKANQYNKAIDIYIELAHASPDSTKNAANFAYAAHIAIKGAEYEKSRANSENETAYNHCLNGKIADAKEHDLNAKAYDSQATRYYERARILSDIGLRLVKEGNTTNNAVLMFLEERMNYAKNMLKGSSRDIIYLEKRKPCEAKPAAPAARQEPAITPKPTIHPEYEHAAV